MDPELESLQALVAGPEWYVVAFVLGALFGSFANVCIARLPMWHDERPETQGFFAGLLGALKRISHPPSHCFTCGKPVAWYDNVPVISYLVLRGRCRHCKTGYSARYMLVEAAVGLLFAATWHLCLFGLWVDDPVPTKLARFAIYAAFQFALVVITFIDIDHKLILDVVTFPAVVVFTVAGLLLQDRPWWDQAIGVAVGYGLVRAISDLYYFLTKREGLGYGDGKLLAVIGALLGWQAVLFGLFGGALLGSVFGVMFLLIGRMRARAPAPPPAAPAEGLADVGEADGVSLRHVELPFGPYIIAAALTYLYLERQIHVGFRSFMYPDGY